MPRLRRSDCTGDGIRRRRRGRGFSYEDSGGERIDDEETLERIRTLAIPPAWADVWVCLDPLGHLQATGIDVAGRKQYLYHEHWHRRAAEQKFESVRDFARALPRLRRRVGADLKLEEIPRERAVACAVRLLDLGFFRVGGEEYAEENGSFGVATVRREHVTIERGEMTFDFPAKSGVQRIQSVRDPASRAAIEKMWRRRSGPSDLIAFHDRGGWHDIRAEDINTYIKTVVGEQFSAKDFRTWHGTVLAAVELARAAPATSKSGREKRVRAAIEAVAEQLGNTPAVCRSSYVDPRLIERFHQGRTIPVPKLTKGRLSETARRRIELAVLDLLG